MLKRVVTLRVVLDEYYVTDRIIRQNTHDRYGFDCKRWEKFTNDPDAREIESNDILGFRNRLIKEKYSVNTIIPNLKTIYYLLKTCKNEGLIGEIPDMGVPIPEEPPSPDPIPFENLERFLEFTHVAHWPNETDYWKRYIGFAYLTGLRRGDLLEITRDHCSAKQIKYKASKTKKTHIYPMPAWLWRMIEPQPAGRLFPVNPKQIYQEMKRISAAAGIDYFSPQDLRILSSNEWETARAGCGAVIQGAAIKGWSKATENYLTTHGLLFRGIGNLKAPNPLLSEAELDKELSDRVRWDQAFEMVPASMREHILALTESIVDSEH